jgi:hypothetical protein
MSGYMKDFAVLVIGISALVFGYLAYSSYQNSQSNFGVIIKNLQAAKTGDPIQDSFIREIQSIYKTENPEVSQDLRYVWVLSSRYSYRKTHVTTSPQNLSSIDVEDGYNRMRLGIWIARRATAKKIGKAEVKLTIEDLTAYGPVILFNGEDENNEVLADVLAKNEITDYPKEKFYIFSLPKEMVHTGGQFQTLKKQHEEGKLNLTSAKIAIITHAYHWPRVGRYFGNVEGYNFLHKVDASVSAYLIDRKFEAPGVINELKSEMHKLGDDSYRRRGKLLPNIADDAIYLGKNR